MEGHLIKLMQNLKKMIVRAPLIRKFLESLNNEFVRDDWVQAQLSKVQSGSVILDAGCGAQRYRKFCSSLVYKSQDFCAYVEDEKASLCDRVGGGGGYKYGEVDYIGDIWSINEKDSHFDAILCTEVFEHIPFPNETIKEFSRLLKNNGKLIITAPSNCMRHMDPYFFYSGFSDRYYEKILSDNGFKIISINPVGDYYSWIAVELYRTIKFCNIFAKFLLLPAFIYFYLKDKTEQSTNTLCMGYHVLAEKIS
jgi:SAM-dependent methyltransferase